MGPGMKSANELVSLHFGLVKIVGLSLDIVSYPRNFEPVNIIKSLLQNL